MPIKGLPPGTSSLQSLTKAVENRSTANQFHGLEKAFERMRRPGCSRKAAAASTSKRIERKKRDRGMDPSGGNNKYKIPKEAIKRVRLQGLAPTASHAAAKAITHDNRQDRSGV